MRRQVGGGVFEQDVGLLIKWTEQCERDVSRPEVLTPKVVIHCFQGVYHLVDAVGRFVSVREQNAFWYPAQVTEVGALEISILIEGLKNTVVIGIVMRSFG